MIAFHPCDFNFDDTDLRRVGNVTSGGASLSGIEDATETSGGGYWRYDLTNGATFDRDENLAWRRVTEAMDGGAAAVLVRFCDKLHQPVGGTMGSVGQPAGTDYASPGCVAAAAASAPLRSTSLQITIASERPLIGGELFTIVHPAWGERVYRIIEVDGPTIRFRPPLREAVTAGTALDFDDPRCRMRLAQPTSNAINIGRYASPSISFVEDMRKPA